MTADELTLLSLLVESTVKDPHQFKQIVNALQPLKRSPAFRASIKIVSRNMTKGQQLDKIAKKLSKHPNQTNKAVGGVLEWAIARFPGFKRDKDAVKAWKLVCKFFGRDHDKTCAWFLSSNPLLGGIRPTDMIVLGRSKKLLQFIQTNLEENKRPDMKK